MLNKLLKYDLQRVFKFLSVFYIFAIFFSILTRIFLSIDNSFIINIISQIFLGTTFAIIANILINSLMRSWLNIKNNFYGDEAYLTHTLPVSKNNLYLSKFITSIITLFVSMIVITLTLFIMFYSKENMSILKNLLKSIALLYDSSIISIILSLIFIIYLEFLNILECGSLGIILGHKMNNNRIIYSVLYGLGIFMLSQLFVLLIVFIISLFNSDIMNLIVTTTVISANTLKLIIIISIILYSIVILIEYFISNILFNKGVNVE